MSDREIFRRKYNQDVNYDRDTKNETMGRNRRKVETQVEQADKKIQSLKDQLKNDTSLTSNQKMKIRNRITAQVARTRQKV